MAEPARRRSRSTPRKSHRVNLALTEREAEVLVEAARRAGLTVSAYTASAALGVARDEITVVPVEERDRFWALMRAQAEVRRVGDYLDELAARLRDETAAVLEGDSGFVRVRRAVEQLELAAARIARGR